MLSWELWGDVWQLQSHGCEERVGKTSHPSLMSNPWGRLVFHWGKCLGRKHGAHYGCVRCWRLPGFVAPVFELRDAEFISYRNHQIQPPVSFIFIFLLLEPGFWLYICAHLQQRCFELQPFRHLCQEPDYSLHAGVDVHFILMDFNILTKGPRNDSNLFWEPGASVFYTSPSCGVLVWLVRAPALSTTFSSWWRVLVLCAGTEELCCEWGALCHTQNNEIK